MDPREGAAPGPADRDGASRTADAVDWRDLFRLRSAEDAERWVRQRVADSGPPQADARAAAERDVVRLVLEAWNAARGELERGELGLRARAIEIGLIQALGQRSAEAAGIRDLFARAADVLGTAGPMQVALALHRIGGVTEAEAFLGVPADSEILLTIARRAERFLDWTAADPLPVAIRRTGAFDGAHGALRTVREQDTTYLPLRRGNRTVACLCLVHATPPDESLRRVLFSAANLLSLHLDRILTVREAEQDRFRSILDSMSPAVVLTDVGLHVRHANRAARPLLEDLGVAVAGGRLVVEDGPDLAALARRVVEGEESTVEDEFCLGPNRFVHASVSAFRSSEGEADGLVVVLTDVTDARRMQQQLAQAEKLSSLGEMISGVAHELNNPLASVLGYAQLVQATTTDDALRSKLDVLDRESRRCQKIVQNLLGFARRHEPERRAYSLNETVESVTALLRYQMRLDGIEVDTRLHGDLPAIHGDSHLLQQVLINLLTNAHHAMRDASRRGTVRIVTAPVVPDGVRCVVEDDGPGVPGELRERVFDPFFTTKRSGHGTGLGLALVHTNVTAEGGTVRLEQAESGGARFVVELPVGCADDPSEAVGAVEDPIGRIPASRILVVEDEAAVADFLREALEEDGHVVTVVADGASALERVAAADFDVAVVDWRVPEIGGRRLLDRLLAAHPDMASRTILTTGDTVSREADAFAERTGLPLLHKPFELRDLRRTVRQRVVGGRGA